MKKPAIEEVFFPNDGKNYPVAKILNKSQKDLFEMRRRLRPSVKELTLLCSTCFQPVILAGYLDQSFYFRHIKDSEDCPIKTNSHLTGDEILAMKYNGQKEGNLHKTNKLRIATLLRKDDSFEYVRVEQTFREQNPTGIAKLWRRPDVAATAIHRRVEVAFELQVSTTFIDVIVAREEFYKDNGAFILWIFLDFSARRFTELDIFYANRSNAFVFDAEADSASEEAGKLILKCHFHRFEVIETSDSVLVETREEWCLVSLDELKYDHSAGKIYYFDSNASELKANEDAGRLKELLANRKRKEYEELLAKQADEKKAREEVERLRLEAEKSRRREELFERQLHHPFSKSNSYPMERASKNKGLSERNYQQLKKNKTFDNLRCEKCNNTEIFFDRACFVYCALCKIEVKY